MASQSQKQEIIDSIKDVTNILVTVSSNPSVDELSAALGLTVFLNELGKHATAVFSGKVPPAISFLEPDKTFEDTADSLRDFIIALDKEKADHLRYKVVDDAVKIFITPYRTTISEKDLEFSQGDYNVELVLALNVSNIEHLDAALSAHGKILHDATVATITSGNIKSALGVIDWHDDKASGVSEMTTELLGSLKTAKVAMDEQMATALLTGIVSSTDRFSNNLTSSRVMSVAAELMAAGANQQLISSKLAESQQVEQESEKKPEKISKSDDEEQYAGDELSIKRTKEVVEPEEPAAKKDDGSLSISHEKSGNVDEVARISRIEEQDRAARAAEAQLSKLQFQEAPIPQPAAPSSPAEPVLEEATPQGLAAPVASEAPATVQQPAPSETQLPPVPAIESIKQVAAAEDSKVNPSLGGTLNATSEQALKDKLDELARDQNKTILKHGGMIGSSQPSFGDTPLNAAMGASDEPPKVDPFAKVNQPAAPVSISAKGVDIPAAPLDGEVAPAPVVTDSNSVMSDLAKDTSALLNSQAEGQKSAMAAVNEALASVPVPDNSTALPVEPARAPTLSEIESGVSTPSETGLPPLPDFSTLPPLPPIPTGLDSAAAPSDIAAPIGAAMPAAPADFNPGTFQIPGQK